MRTKIRANTDLKKQHILSLEKISANYLRIREKKHQSTAKCKSGLVTKDRFSNQFLKYQTQEKDNKF